MKNDKAFHRKQSIALWLLSFLFLLSGCGRQEHSSAVTKIMDLNSPEFTIGIMTGSAAAEEARKRLPEAEYMEYPMPVDAFAAICSGKIDAVVLDRPTLEYMTLAHPELCVTKEDLAVGHISVAAAKWNGKLILDVDRFIRSYRKDGTYQQMFDRWFHTKNPVMPEIPQAGFFRKRLRIGITANNEPMCFLKDGKLAGFDTEFSLRLGVFLNRKVEFADLPYDALPAALESGKIDLAVACMDAIPERMESVLFSENYVDSPVTILIAKAKYKPSGKIFSLQDLDSPTQILACESEILATKEAKKRLSNATFLEFASPLECYAALSSGKASAIVYDRPALEYAALEHPDFLVLPEDIAVGHISIASGKRNKELIRRVNDFLRDYRKNGTYEDMYRRWILSRTPDMPEIGKPSSPAGKLMIGVTADNPPMCFIRNGKMTGFDVELALRLGLFLNKEVVFMNYVFDGLVPALQSGKIDLAIACMDVTEERASSVLFTEEYIDSPVAAMILRRNYGKDEVSGEQDASVREMLKDAVSSLAESFDKTFLRESRWKLILQGLATTIIITCFSVLFGTVFAFPVCMMCRSKHKLISWLGERYVSLIMGTPILVILMILYYVVFAKVDISGIAVAVLAFSLDFAAYTSVTLRSGIDGIPVGQTEAALALGYTSRAAFFRFVLPQAVRTVLPVYRGEIISTLKSTSIVGYIAIMDLTKMGDIIRSRTYEAFFPLLAIAAIYFLTAKCLTALLTVLENAINPERRRELLRKRAAK